MRPPDDRRLLSQRECERIYARVVQAATGGGTIAVRITTWWNGELRWARNRVTLASDRRDITVHVTRDTPGGFSGWVVTNQTDAESLAGAVRAAERTSQLRKRLAPPWLEVDAPTLPTPHATVWSDATFQVTAEQRGILAQQLVDSAEARGMASAGYLEMRACEYASISTKSSVMRYETLTQAQCSMTVRHPKGLGSGWAGLSSFDWSAIDGSTLAQRALEKCLASIDPVRIEPGRYTVVLEPQAVCDLVTVLMGHFARYWGGAEQGRGPFVLGFDETVQLWRSKLGLKVVDERITISHDPEDPALGVVAQSGLTPITWIQNGILTALDQSSGVPFGRKNYALPYLNDNVPVIDRPAFRMSGGPTSIDEMIATTERGLLVTRFSNLMQLDSETVLVTGVTRDGLWLIEHGSISKSVKNMRMTESPLFVLNQIDQLGPSVPVFRPVRPPEQYALTPAIVPPLKVNDFSFTSLIDAV